MENILWLQENGGPAIKLNMMNEGLIGKSSYDTQGLVDELLEIEKVREALSYFDRFKDYKSIPLKKLYANIHNCYEDCFEMFMPYFINLGFRAGIPVFDEKVNIMRETYRYLMSLGNDYVSQIIMLMLEAGYFYDEMLEFLNRFINKRYETAKRQCFDVYETDPSKIRYSKLPKEWRNGPVLKDIHVHSFDETELPLPTIYDVRYIADIYSYVEDTSVKEKMDVIIKYILHPEYQKLDGNYGYGWWYNKAYYANSPGVRLPLYEGRKIDAGYKNNLEFMSRIPLVTDTEWFLSCVNSLEAYKTERGTYILPEDCFYHTFVRPANTALVYSTFISSAAKVKRSEKRFFVIELLSTYFVELMKHRIHRYK